MKLLKLKRRIIEFLIKLENTKHGSSRGAQRICQNPVEEELMTCGRMKLENVDEIYAEFHGGEANWTGFEIQSQTT